MNKMFSKLSFDILHSGHDCVGNEWEYTNFAQNFIKMYFINSGKGIIRYQEKELILEPGNLYLIPPFIPADYYVLEPPMDHFHIHFYAKAENNISANALFDFHKSISLASPEVIKHLYSRLLEIYAKPTDFDMIEADSILHYLFGLFRKKSPKCLNETLRKIKRFEPVLDYIEEHYAEKITLDEMAAMIHLQPAYFSTAFKKVFNQSPVEYAISKKLEKAQGMLFFTNKSVKEIAYQTGFNDEFYFSRIFKKYLDMSPSEFRQRKKY